MNRADIMGRKLLQLRSQRRLSRRKVCEAIGISHTPLWRYETKGELMPTAAMLRICEFYDITPNELFGFQENENENISNIKFTIE